MSGSVIDSRTCKSTYAIVKCITSRLQMRGLDDGDMCGTEEARERMVWYVCGK